MLGDVSTDATTAISLISDVFDVPQMAFVTSTFLQLAVFKHSGCVYRLCRSCELQIRLRQPKSTRCFCTCAILSCFSFRGHTCSIQAHERRRGGPCVLHDAFSVRSKLDSSYVLCCEHSTNTDCRRWAHANIEYAIAAAGFSACCARCAEYYSDFATSLNIRLVVVKHATIVGATSITGTLFTTCLFSHALIW
jgi:hypothetical protein